MTSDLLQNLTMLSLRENKIRELPPGIGKLTQLGTIDASNNHLQTLPPGNDSPFPLNSDSRPCCDRDRELRPSHDAGCPA